MKKLLFLLLFTASLTNSFAQELNDLYSKAYRAYLEKDYAKASELFSLFRTDYHLHDELLASSIFYQGESFSNSGQYDEAVISYLTLINNYGFTSFREKAMFKTGLLYYEKHEYGNSQEMFQQLNKEYPGNEFYGSSLYWIGETYTKQNNIK